MGRTRGGYGTTSGGWQLGHALEISKEHWLGKTKPDQLPGGLADNREHIPVVPQHAELGVEVDRRTVRTACRYFASCRVG